MVLIYCSLLSSLLPNAHLYIYMNFYTVKYIRTVILFQSEADVEKQCKKTKNEYGNALKLQI